MNAIRAKSIRDLTAGDVALHLRCCVKLARDLIDSGRLPGYRLPTGSRDRRVTRESLAEFMRSQGIPCQFHLPPQVIAYGLKQIQIESAVEAGLDGIEVATSMFSLGRALNDQIPDHVVILHAGSIGRSETLETVRLIREQIPQSWIGVILPEDGRHEDYVGVDGTALEPTDARSMMAAAAARLKARRAGT